MLNQLILLFNDKLDCRGINVALKLRKTEIKKRKNVLKNGFNRNMHR